MTLPPWEYLFTAFNHDNFPDMFHPTWIASLVLLVVLAILYFVRTRALKRHPPYLDMGEWVTHAFGLHEVGQAIRVASNQTEERPIKVVLDPHLNGSRLLESHRSE